MVNEAFPSSYEQHLKSFDFGNYFAVDFSKFYLLLSVLSKVYRSSGIVILRAKEDVLYLESKSLDGEMSFMVLSKSKKGTIADCELSFSVDGLLAVLKSLKNFDYLNLTISGNSFSLFNETVSLAVFGTETSVKADVFKMKKQAKRDARDKKPVEEKPAS